MRLAPTRVGPLLLLAGSAFAVSTAALQLRQAGGAATPTPPLAAALVVAALAFALLVVAWPIRRWNAGERDRAVDPLRAARTVALAKASALAGALLTGGWVGFVGVALPAVTLTSQPGRVVASAAVVLASVGLTVAGLVAERWCMIPPEDDDEHGGGSRGGGGRQPSPA
ncbi:DUF3180 domain-containing protein [Jannaschia sp. R86511]|uniref:DUF3180 domain-containing protein n=1 Tax=Jannaschia sp. R86511 TaxID=3093853 RepID=UPI0036D3F8B4